MCTTCSLSLLSNIMRLWGEYLHFTKSWLEESVDNEESSDAKVLSSSITSLSPFPEFLLWFPVSFTSSSSFSVSTWGSGSLDNIPWIKSHTDTLQNVVYHPCTGVYWLHNAHDVVIPINKASLIPITATQLVTLDVFFLPKKLFISCKNLLASCVLSLIVNIGYWKSMACSWS